MNIINYLVTTFITVSSFSFFKSISHQSKISNSSFESSKETLNIDEDILLFIQNNGWKGSCEETIIERYEDLLNHVEDLEKAKISQAILDAKIAAYTICVKESGYFSYYDYASNKRENNREINDLILNAAISYLDDSGCYLTVELMNHFLSQNTPPSSGYYYDPVYGWETNYGSQSLSIIQSSNSSGGGCYNSSNSTYELDLKCSIKHFSYNKKESSAKGFLLTDTYDFEEMEPGLNPFGIDYWIAVANNRMFYYQENGSCYPYDIRIKVAPPSSSISIGTYTHLDEYDYRIDNDIYVAYQLNVSGHYQDAVLMTSGYMLVSIHIYDNDDHTFLGTYSGNGFSLNTLCKPNFSSNNTYYILIKSHSNEFGNGRLSVFKNVLDDDEIFSTNIVTSTGNYADTTTMWSMTSFVISMSVSGNYTFVISNGYEEYGFGFYLINTLFHTSVECEWSYEPTYSTLSTYISANIDYLLIVYYEDFLDGGNNFILNITNV